MKKIAILFSLVLLLFGCTKNEQNDKQQSTTQPPENNQPAAKETDQTPQTGPQNGISVSRKTTRIMGPLDDAGYVDYLQALNDQASSGVNAKNNYEVIVRQVMTSEPILEELQTEYFHLLGIPVPDKGTPVYQDFVDFTLQGNTDRQQSDTLLDEQDRLMTKPWQAAEHPAASKWLAAQKKHLDQLVEGSRREKFYAPYLTAHSDEDASSSTVISMLLPSVQQQREIVRGLKIRALGRIATGDLDNAWTDLQAIHRIARHAGSGVTIIETLVGIVIDSMAFEAEVYLLNSPGLTAEQSKRFLADVQALKPLPSIADRIDVGERFMALDAATMLARSVHGKDPQQTIIELFKSLKLFEALSSTTATRDLVTLVALEEDSSKQKSQQVGNPIDWDSTLQVLNHWYDKLVAAQRLENSQQRLAALAKIGQELEQLATNMTNPTKQLAAMATDGSPKVLGEAIGNILLTILMPAAKGIALASDDAVTRTSIIRIGFALKLHTHETGMVPNSLAELSPRYLESIPVDPHSGSALKYVPQEKGFLLYSVGRNGVDDQGKSAEDAERVEGRQSDWDDIVLRVGS